MGNKLAVTDNGKHKIAKKLFLTDENHVHRKARKAFLTKDGVHRLVYSSGTIWEKYNCEIFVEGGDYKEVPAYGGGNSYYNTTTITCYDSYDFSTEDGYSGIGEGTYNLPADSSSVIGKYMVSKYRDYARDILCSSVERIDSFSSQGDDDWPSSAPSGYTRCIKYTRVALSEETPLEYSYEQGYAHYGTIEVEDGELPENGELIEGSAKNSYCVLRIDGEYYYYVRGD